ncbi:peptidase associated/transthyretin-like domain-containing protein [Leeuwenhoekiella aequorea]|uniref:Carboxypeptidase-like protein n=1 Tax=Leeuwenhoekiella aequorea TaxID=283736 RepID=A0A4Q0PEC9_9FLAO|nr:hypothetical protein [Leeuwenhoekiella aequorea]RXG24836.1 hypothetical protein DSM00_632 [Leeuwenhoekiella aequorea]
MLIPLHIQGQEAIQLTGKITNDSIDHEYLHVLNLTLQKGTITNEKGVFRIPVREQDTLYISAVQFKPKEVVITSEIIAKNFLKLELETNVTELEDVNISDIDLSGRLGDDMNIPKVEKPFNPADAGLPVYTGPIITQEERKLYTATHSGGGIIPVNAVINAISGRTKMLKNHVRISNMEIRVQKARNLVSDSTYIYQLNIPAKYIDDFAHYIYQDKTENLQIASEDNPLSLIELLMDQAPLYLQFKQIDGVNLQKKE